MKFWTHHIMSSLVHSYTCVLIVRIYLVVVGGEKRCRAKVLLGLTFHLPN